MSLENITNKIFPKKTIPAKIVFRVDAGREWGLSFGHLFRCLILANYMVKYHETEIIFLMKDIQEGIDCAQQLGLQVVTIPNNPNKKTEHQQVIANLEHIKPGALIVDIPTIENITYVDWARNNNITSIYIDDQDNNKIHPNVLINGRADFTKNNYEPLKNSVQYLCGKKYFIMEDLPPWQKGTNKKKRVLITFGGTDLSGLTEKTIGTIEQHIWEDVAFTIILGPGFHPKRAKNLHQTLFKNTITLLSNPSSIHPLYYKHDLCICAGGRTLSELLAIAMPSLPIASIQHETVLITSLLKSKHIKLGLKQWHPTPFIIHLKAALAA